MTLPKLPPRLALLCLLVFGSLWGLPTHAANTPSCTLNGGSGPNAWTDCTVPVTTWQYPGYFDPGYTTTLQDAIPAGYDTFITHNPHLCDHGCSYEYKPATAPNGLQSGSVYVHANNSNGTVQTSTVALNAKYLCPINSNPVSDWSPDGANTTIVCRPNLDTSAALTRAEGADVSNPDSSCHTCNPVNLGDSNKQDYVVDYQNHSPYPIVWSRYYNGRSRQWFFNYDRFLAGASAIAGRGAALTAAGVTLRRQDGQTLAFSGTKSGTTWTWVPNLGNAAKNAMVLGTLTSSDDLTTFSFKNHQDETESYNAAGQLVSLTDIHGLTLSLARDSLGRLSTVTDASGRVLTLTYPASTPKLAHSVDASGNPVDTPYSSYTKSGDAAVPNWPDTASDGTRQIGYVFLANPAASASQQTIVLASVIKPDGKVLTYNYDSNNRYTGLTDEKGDRYSTYSYNSNGTVLQTYHGTNHETVTLTSNNKVQTPSGQLVNYSANAQTLKLTSMTAPCSWCMGNQHASVLYDAAANPTTIKDFNNNTQTRVYDQARGVPTSITDASGTAIARTTTYTWDARFLKPTSVTTPAATPNGAGSLVSTFVYDPTGNLTFWTKTATGPGAYSKTVSGAMTWNTAGQPLTVTDAKGHVTTYSYDAAGNLSTLQNALGQTVTFADYDSAGNPGSMTDPNGLRVEMTYDALQNLTQIRKGCSGTPASGTGPWHWETTMVTYTPFAMVETVTLPSGRGLKYHYDTAHRVISIDETGEGGSVLGTTTQTLTESSLVSSKTFRDASGNVVQTQGMDYDALLNLKSAIDSRSKVFGQTWDSEGNLLVTRDPLSHSQTRLYDALNRLTKTTLADSTTELASYNPDDTVASQTDAAGHVTTYTLDGFGHVATRTSPDSGLTTYGYDNNFNLTTVTDARGKTLTTLFDSLDRPLQQAASSGETFVWSYDTCANGVGLLCSVTDRTGTTTFAYDRWGRMTQKGVMLVGMTAGLNLSYSYDDKGQLSTVTYPSGLSLSQTWHNGDVTALDKNGTGLLSAVSYDPWHRLKGWTWPSGRSVAYAYDTDGRMQMVSGGTSTQTFTRDDAWRLTGVSRQPGAQTTTFGYDNRDRLVSGTTWGTYSYDANSNRLGWLGALGPMSYGVTSGTNRLGTLNGGTVVTDSAGNITGRPDGSSLTFDDWGRLRSFAKSGVITSYGVNALGERVSKAGAAPVFYLYAGIGQLMGAYASDGTPVEEVVYLNGRPVADVRPTGTYVIETDHLAAPVRVLDSANSVVWSWEDREPFGGNDPTQGTVNGQPFVLNLRFPGQIFDAESGLAQNGYRDYDATLGRYIEVDPMGLAAGMNTYGYVGGSPLMGVDSSGLIEKYSNGTMVFKPGKGEIPFPSYENPQASLGFGEIYTDFGTAVQVNPWISGDIGYTQNCHGYALDIPYWVNDPSDVYEQEYEKTDMSHAEIVYYPLPIDKKTGRLDGNATDHSAKVFPNGMTSGKLGGGMIISIPLWLNNMIHGTHPIYYRKKWS